MATAIKRRHNRDLRFIGMLALTLALLGLFLAGQHQSLSSEGSAWRRIDMQALQERIDSGELSDREALWYHPASGSSQSMPESQR